MNWTAHGATDVGRKRARNEDAYVIDGGLELALVADGMGGHACGDEASRMVAAVFRDAIAESSQTIDDYANAPPGADTAPLRKLLRSAMARCSKAVYDESMRDPGKRGMGTTCSALLFAGSTAFVAHVGDSRVYLIRDGRLVQLTCDHSMLADLVAEGEITQEEADSPLFNKYRSALSRAVGIAARVDTDTLAVEALPCDTYLLCSDGLTRYVGDEELVELVRHVPPDSLETALIRVANERGGADNITVVTVRLVPETAENPERVERLEERVAALRANPLFDQVDYAEILHVLTVAHTVAIAEHGTLVEEDDVEEMGLCVVLSGGGELQLRDGGVETLSAGDWFGSISMLSGDDRLGSLVATEPTRVLRFLRADLIDILGKSPSIGQRLLRAVADM